MRDNNANFKIQSWPRRWYTFNFQKIPAIFITIGVVFFTAFLDFEVQGTTIKLQSHIAAIRKFLNTPLNNFSAFLLFLIYLVAILQLFNSLGYAKHRSGKSLIFLSFLTILQTTAVGIYTYIFFNEQASRLDYVIDNVARFSYTIFIIGTIFFLIGTFFAWLYVDWTYVKSKE
jgi:hypothetical protein